MEMPFSLRIYEIYDMIARIRYIMNVNSFPSYLYKCVLTDTQILPTETIENNYNNLNLLLKYYLF